MWNHPYPLRVRQLVCPASAGTVRTVSLGNQLLTIQFTLGFNPLSGPHRKRRRANRRSPFGPLTWHDIFCFVLFFCYCSFCCCFGNASVVCSEEKKVCLYLTNSLFLSYSFCSNNNITIILIITVLANFRAILLSFKYRGLTDLLHQ